ncbi:hypothetical protein A0R60_1944 [Enterobacter asburiae]|nr:hypothetical protein A0R60_1944 [Enterobacter asburiae]
MIYLTVNRLFLDKMTMLSITERKMKHGKQQSLNAPYKADNTYHDVCPPKLL